MRSTLSMVNSKCFTLVGSLAINNVVKRVGVILFSCLGLACSNSPESKHADKSAIEKLNLELESCPWNDLLCESVLAINKSDYYTVKRELEHDYEEAFNALEYSSKDDLFSIGTKIVQFDEQIGAFTDIKGLKDMDSSVVVITLRSAGIDYKYNMGVSVISSSNLKLLSEKRLNEVLFILLKRCMNKNKNITISMESKINDLKSQLSEFNQFTDLILVEPIFYQAPVEVVKTGGKGESMGEFKSGCLLQRATRMNFRRGINEVFWIKSGNGVIELGDLEEGLYANAEYVLGQLLGNSIMLR